MGSKIRCRNPRFKEGITAGAKLLRNTEGEALFNFGSYLDTKYNFVYGIGTILGIEHSEKADVITINFGRKKRKIIANTNHARRQVYTLKVGQYAHVLGVFKKWKYYDAENQKWEYKYSLFAKALQGWYVPKQFDMEKGNEDFREMSEETEEELSNILDNLEIS